MHRSTFLSNFRNRFKWMDVTIEEKRTFFSSVSLKEKDSTWLNQCVSVRRKQLHHMNKWRSFRSVCWWHWCSRPHRENMYHHSPSNNDRFASIDFTFPYSSLRVNGSLGPYKPWKNSTSFMCVNGPNHRILEMKVWLSLLDYCISFPDSSITKHMTILYHYFGHKHEVRSNRDDKKWTLYVFFILKWQFCIVIVNK